MTQQKSTQEAIRFPELIKEIRDELTTRISDISSNEPLNIETTKLLKEITTIVKELDKMVKERDEEREQASEKTSFFDLFKERTLINDYENGN